MLPSSQSSISSTASGSTAIPPKRRRVVNDAAAVVQNPELEEEDDTEELRNRRIQHIVEKARSHGTPPGSPRSRSINAAVGRNGMTNAQITDHYASCLKLCAENKINAKNAFNLHLIDYMSDMLRQPDNTETNFQIAGTSLDASAKIYAYRVETVHRETLKIAGGLGRPDRNSNRHDDDDVDLGEGVPFDNDEPIKKPAKKKRRKKVTKGNTIETNLKSLKMVANNDSGFAGDALFDKVRSNFDEGSSSGLFLNSLFSIHDSNRLLLHYLVTEPPDPPTERPPIERSPLEIAEIASLFDNINLDGAKGTCPGLGDFGFVGWKPDTRSECEMVTGCQEEPATTLDDLRGRYVVELPPAPPTPMPQRDFDRDDDDDGDCDGFDHHDEFDTTNEIAAAERSNLCTGNAGAVTTTTTSNPQALPCFDLSNASTFVGESHWRVKAKLHSLKREYVDGKGGGNGPAAKGRKVSLTRPRKRNEPARISFKEEIDSNAAVPMGTGSTTLSKITLDKWRNESSSLDMAVEDDCATIGSLHRLFTKPDLWLMDVKSDPQGATTTMADGAVVNATCAAAGGQLSSMQGDALMDDDDDDDDDDFGCDFGGALMMGEDALAAAQHGDCSGANAVTDDVGGAAGAGAAGAGFSGSLLPLPTGVQNKLAIPPYERRAKKIDAKKTKEAIWKILTTDSANLVGTTEQDVAERSPSEKMTKPMAFSTVCAELPKHLPGPLAGNLSVHIMFACLLHICNERSLVLENQDDLSDFTIKPPE